MSKPLQNSKKVCCVVGCKSKPGNGIHFYSFPNQPWEKERKNKWIAAVRRLTIDNKPWYPTKYSKICSVHFVGGEKSNDPRNVSFNPSIFPSIYRKKQLSDNQIRRAERLKARNTKKVSSVTEIFQFNINEEIIENKTEIDNNVTKSVEVQTDFSDFTDDKLPNVLFCTLYSNNEAETQANLSVQFKKREESIKMPYNILPKPMKSVCVGPDTDMHEGFYGFENIKDDETLKQVGGVTLSLFAILLQFIKPNATAQPKYFKCLNAQNRLLLFLMKMKLGLTFTALACLFNISKSSASNIFYSVLETIYVNVNTWIFWPSKEAIKETMPLSFKNYSDCRAIIDCTELRCDCPPTVEQRVLMYSSYKSCFTVKFLIAITPSGFISFISKGYGGRATDSFITNDSGFLSLVEPGDLILADKGFPQIRSELVKRNCTLVMPPFAYNPQFTPEEVLQGYSIASVRIHVERAIQRVKIFKILQHVNIEILPYIDKIMFVACVLANNKEPLIVDKSMHKV